MTHDHDSRDDASISKVTRRGVMAAVGLGGLAALGGGSASGQTVGGGDADELADHLTRLYEGDEADLPSAGVAGRRFIVLDSGGSYDPGTILRDDGSSWSPINLGVESLSSENLNNEVYASQFDGADLSSKVDSALDWLLNNAGGQGRVRVTPKDDGTAWAWSDWTITPGDFAGIEIKIDENVNIEYDGSGTAVHVNYPNGTFLTGHFRLSGGIWTATGDPDTWCRLENATHAVVKPHSLLNWNNSSTDCTAFLLQNTDDYTESLVLGCEGGIVADRGVDMEPASVTGGGGTESFHDIEAENLQLNIQDFGVRLAGKAQYQRWNCKIFCKADNAAGYVLDRSGATTGWFTGTKIMGKVETIGSSADTYGVRVSSNYDGFRPPTFGPGFKGNGGGASWVDDPSGGGETVPLIESSASELKLIDKNRDQGLVIEEGGRVAADRSLSVRDTDGNEALRMFDNFGLKIIKDQDTDNLVLLDGDTLGWKDGFGGSLRASFAIDGTVWTEPKDVRNISSPEQGDRAYHDGSGNAGEGVAYYDGGNWNVLDGGTQP